MTDKEFEIYVSESGRILRAPKDLTEDQIFMMIWVGGLVTDQKKYTVMEDKNVASDLLSIGRSEKIRRIVYIVE